MSYAFGRTWLNLTCLDDYQWCHRAPSLWARTDECLGVHIRMIHSDSRETYGSPRVAAQLRRDGFQVGTKRVARLMRQQGLWGHRRRKYRKTTLSDHGRPVAPNHLMRQFHINPPNRVWAADITYIKTWQGFSYLAVVIDLYSRRVVGWAAADHMRTALPLDALRMAFGNRRPAPLLMHHSDQGSQYAADAYLAEVHANQAIPSMSDRGDCWDNAVVESFFGTLKNEFIYRHTWPTRDAARAAIADYIELFYNSRRIHLTLNNMSPMEFERCCETEVAQAA
jgi:putative transposase